MKVLVSEASLNTVAVEVNALTIKGRQVTLAVFRQLIEEYPKESDNPIIWGFVNYHPDKKICESRGEHRHIVWQKDDELRRATVFKSRVWEDPFAWIGLVEIYMRDGITEHDNDKIADILHRRRFIPGAGYEMTYHTRDDGSEEVFCLKNSSTPDKTIGELKQSLPDYKNDIAKKKMEEVDRIADWGFKLYKESIKAPQLFIAM